MFYGEISNIIAYNMASEMHHGGEILKQISSK